jgi:chromosome segregation ATPase
MSEKLYKQAESVKQETGSVKQEVERQLEATTKEIQERLNYHLRETQNQLQIQVREIKDQIKTQTKEMENLRQECQGKYEKLKQTQLAEIAAECRQIKAGINKREGIWEQELTGLKEQMVKDNKKQDKVRGNLQKQLEENKGKIENNESRIMRIEKVTEENQRRQREEGDEIKQQIEQGQSEVTKEIDKIGKEVRELKQGLKLQTEVRTAGAPRLAPFLVEESQQNEPVHTKRGETVQPGTYRGIQGLGSGEFPLPTFDENAGVNPVSHLRQLEEFFKFWGVQSRHWLTVAKRSIIGPMSKQWLEATSPKD